MKDEEGAALKGREEFLQPPVEGLQLVFQGFEPPLIEPDRLTLASMLREKGYATAAVGKWHVGLGWTTKDGKDPKPDGTNVDYSVPITGGPLDLGFDTCWIIPEGFPARIDQGLRLVGTEGIMEIDSQDRGSQSVLARDGKTVTYNPGFLKRRTDQSGSEYWTGYGMESIEDFVHNVSLVKAGRDPETLTGIHATGRDGLEATKIAEAAHRSAETGDIVAL